MAYFSRILTLILIIKLVALSTTVRVIPYGYTFPEREIRFREGIRRQNDCIVQHQFLSIPARRYRVVEYEEIFHTARNQIITEVLVEDGALHDPALRVRLIHNGVGYQNVTLKFISARNSGIVQWVTLYGH